MSPLQKKALLVESETGPAAELRTLLTELDFDVKAVAETDRFSEVLGHRRYDLAVINVSLPDTNWPGTLERAKELSRTTTVITVRRSVESAELRHALVSGRYAVIDGPLTREKLADVIKPESDGLFVVVR